MTLRPHHGLCTLFFGGKGYSEAFTRHMTETIRTLRQGAPVRLDMEADEICKGCPKRRGRACSGSKAAAYDRAVLALTGLREGEELTLSRLQECVRMDILLPGRLEEVCGGCQWAALCQRAWRRMQTGE